MLRHSSVFLFVAKLAVIGFCGLVGWADEIVVFRFIGRMTEWSGGRASVTFFV